MVFSLLLFLLAVSAATSSQPSQHRSSASNSPPLPLPPEPSPPPPPPPRPPEPSPPGTKQQDDEVLVLHFLDGDDTAIHVRQGEMQGPSLLLHMIISGLSMVAMLVLTCSLRAQTLRRVRVRPSVAIARPVLQLYGMLPNTDSHAAASELVDVVDGSDNTGGPSSSQPPSQPSAEGTALPSEAETIQMEVIRTPADWTNCVAVPLASEVAVGQRVEVEPEVEWGAEGAAATEMVETSLSPSVTAYPADGART